MAVAKIIRAKRREKNLTQEKLAQKIGVSKNNIISWEKGRYEPSGKNLINLMKLLELSLKDLETPTPASAAVETEADAVVGAGVGASAGE